MLKTELPNDLVITGLGVISPLGLGLEPLVEALAQGASAVRPLTRFPVKPWTQARLAATVPDFSLAEVTGNPKESARASPLFKLAWAAAHLALQNANLPLGGGLGERTGIFVGLSWFIAEYLERLLQKGHEGRFQEILPIRIENIHPYGSAGQLSYLYKILGPTLTFSAAGQSAIQALEAALLCFERRRIDIALVLSSDVLSPYRFHCEAAAGIVSASSDPEHAPRPYDRGADGAVPSEGAVALVLERGREARARGAKILGQVRELRTLSRPSPFPPAPEGIGYPPETLTGLLNRLDGDRIGVIYGDGKGIPALDEAEASGLRQALGSRAPRVPLTSIQGCLGDAAGTSALFQVAAMVQSLTSSLIFPIRNLERPFCGEELDYVVGQPRRAELEVAMGLSHGWGGGHSLILLQRPE